MDGTAPIKVAVLLPSLELGGAERLVLEEIAVLRNDGRFYLELHLLFQEGPLFGQFLALSVPARVWNARHGSAASILWACWRLARYLRIRGFSVVHCHLLYKLGTWVGVLARMRKIVTTIHTIKALTRTDMAGLNRNHEVLACGRQVSDYLERFLPPSRIKVLNNAIAVPERGSGLRIEADRAYGLEAGQKIILSAGRLIYDKGFDVLVEAFRIVAKDYPTSLLIIAGDGGEWERLERQIKASSLQANVRLLGPIRDMAPLYERADIYVNSSRREGLPMTLLEAMAYGKAIVAVNVGGNKDVIIDNVTGRLVERLESKLLADAIIELLGNVEKCMGLSREAAIFVKENFNIEKHCEDLSLVYQC